MALGLWFEANLTCPEYTNERLTILDTRLNGLLTTRSKPSAHHQLLPCLDRKAGA